MGGSLLMPPHKRREEQTAKRGVNRGHTGWEKIVEVKREGSEVGGVENIVLQALAGARNRGRACGSMWRT